MLHSRFFHTLAFSVSCLLTASNLQAQSSLTADHSTSSFTIQANGSSSLGTATLQSGADLRFGASTPNYTIGQGHDILLGRSLGQNEAKLRVALKAPTSLTAAELAGTWKVYDYEVAEDDDNDFSTSSDTFVVQADTFTIDANRRATADLQGVVTFAVNASKDLMVATNTDPGIESLIIFVRLESGGSTSQMAGSWTLGSFGADFSEDTPDYWYDGDTMTASSGGSLVLSDGSANWSANGDGSITFGDSEGSTTLSVSQSRNILAYTKTVGNSPDQGYEGAIVLRHATSPSIAALAGNWTLITYEIKSVGGDGDPNTVETFHSDGTTLASRERYADGQLHGQPARETWDENGNPTLVEDYTEGALTHSIQTNYIGDLLSDSTETAYDGLTTTSTLVLVYHADGETLSQRSTVYPSVDGELSINDFYNENGTQTEHTRSLDGKRDGLQQDWYPDGKVNSETTYSHGILLSSNTWTYHPNGQISAKNSYTYTSGVEIQDTHTWWENGTKAGVSHNRNSKLHGVQETYNADGKQINSRSYLDGIKHGPFRVWFEGSDQLESESNFENDKLHGLLTYWNEDGSTQETQEYKDDLRHGERHIYSYHPSGVASNKAYSIWNYGEERYREEWWFFESGALNTHSLSRTAAGDLQSGTTPDYSLGEGFDEQGRPSFYFEFRNGKYDGVERFWSEGILTSETLYKEGQFHGRKREWNQSSGNIQYDQSFENDLPHGPFKYYSDGVLTKSGTYVLGLREGVVKTYDSGGTTTETFLHDILHGPYSSSTAAGNYENGLKEGSWESYSEGILYRKTEYKEGTQHGTDETFSGGKVSQRYRYTNGQLDGLQENFSSGVLSSETTFTKGLEVGPQRSYHPNGQLASNTPIDGGLAHGSYKAYDAQGRTITSGTYNHGAQNGTWTTTTYDSEGQANSESENLGSTPPDTNSRGINGTVTSGGKGVSDVQLQLSGASASTGRDGSFFLDLSTYSGPNQLTLSHPHFPEKTVQFTLPSNYSHTTQNFIIDEADSPSLALGSPDMPGTYFLRGSNFSVNYRNLQRPGGDDSNRPELLWTKPNGNTYPGPNDLSIKPGIDTNDSGYAGVLFTRSAPGIESGTIEFPTYHISKNPLWAKNLGGWETFWEGDSNQPGEYRMIRSWPPTPLNIGISRDTIGELAWPIWSNLPVIGSDLGLFGVQFKLNAAARTDGTGNVTFGGQGEIRAAKKTLRIEADGEGLLRWSDTLELSQASVLLRGTLSAKETLTTQSFFPVLKDLESNLLFGGYLKRLNQIAKIEVEMGGGVGGRFPIDAVNGELQFAPTELELNFLSVGKLGIKWFPLEVDLSHRSVGRALFDPTGANISLKKISLDGTSKAKLRIFDFKKELPPVIHQIAYEPIPSSVESNPIQTHNDSAFSLIQPDFVTHNYALFESRISLFSEKVGASLLANPQPDHTFATPSTDTTAASNLLVSNIYPHANPVIAQQGSTRAITYIHFDPDRPEGQSTRLYTSFDTGNGFSEPAPVHTQNRADFNPQLAPLADGRFIAIWETSQLDQIATEVEERIQGLEIAWSIYTPSNQSWTAPALLSNNNHIDFNPIIASSPQGLMLAWQSNADNQLLPTEQSPGQTNITTWNGTGFTTPNTLPSGIRPIERGTLAYDGTKAVYAYIADADQDPTTTDDSELYFTRFNGNAWQTPIRATNDQSIDTTPRVFCLNGETFELVWRKDNDLLRISDFDTLTYELIRDQEQGAAPTQFDVTCDSQGRLALIWGSLKDQQSDLRYALYDPDSGTWSDEIALTNDDAFEAVPSFLLDADGKLLATYLSEDNDTEQRDLRWLECELGRDLTVTAIQIDPIADNPGSYDIQATIQNLGALPSSSASLTFYSGDPDNGGNLINEQSVTLKGGEQSQVTIQASGLINDRIYVRIDSMGTVDERDETNNTASTALNPTALAASSFTWDRTVSDETTLTLVGTVTNDGANPQTNIPVQITDESGTLYSTNIATLAAGETTEITTTLTSLNQSEYRFTLVVDPDNTLAEPDRSDNEFPLQLSLTHLADSDGDGMENAWEQLHFGTLNRDGRGDLDGDGLTDTFEFLTQNDPNDPNSRFPIGISLSSEGNNSAQITFPTILGRNYRIQTSIDSESWETYSILQGTGSEQRLSVPLGSANFYRVQIALQ